MNQTNDKNTVNFESALAELESIVRKLEASQVTLEESITLYQRGLELYGYCFEQLQQAEQLIVKMNNEGEEA